MLKTSAAFAATLPVPLIPPKVPSEPFRHTSRPHSHDPNMRMSKLRETPLSSAFADESASARRGETGRHGQRDAVTFRDAPPIVVLFEGLHRLCPQRRNTLPQPVPVRFNIHKLASCPRTERLYVRPRCSERRYSTQTGSHQKGTDTHSARSVRRRTGQGTFAALPSFDCHAGSVAVAQQDTTLPWGSHPEEIRQPLSRRHPTPDTRRRVIGEILPKDKLAALI